MDFILLDKIPVSTIELPQRRFHTFLDISLPEKLFGNLHSSEKITFVRGASSGVSNEI